MTQLGKATIKFFKDLYSSLIDFILHIFRFCGFSVMAIIYFFEKPIYLNILINQIKYLGFFSIPVISLTAIFSGAVLALQTYYGMGELSAQSAVPMVVILSLVRELGPVLSGLILAGRAGAFITAEISTMKVTDQIDAIYTMSIDPVKYLVTPRIIATLLSLPLLVIVFNVLGFIGGYSVSVYQLNFSSGQYITDSLDHIKALDIISGLIKALFFGLIIGANSCYKGYFASGGARGVGIATTNAVVTSSIMILISNYLITKWFV